MASVAIVERGRLIVVSGAVWLGRAWLRWPVLPHAFSGHGAMTCVCMLHVIVTVERKRWKWLTGSDRPSDGDSGSGWLGQQLRPEVAECVLAIAGSCMLRTVEREALSVTRAGLTTRAVSLSGTV